MHIDLVLLLILGHMFELCNIVTVISRNYGLFMIESMILGKLYSEIGTAFQFFFFSFILIKMAELFFGH